jgi:DNA-binding response OmpR family regulator
MIMRQSQLAPNPVNTKHLLIVEDDFVTRTLLREVLEKAGYQVSAVSDAPEALTFLQQKGLPHLVLVDLGLPSMHGFALSERIKHMGDVPIIIITGDDSQEAIVYGIQKYAEDYMTKPFNVNEVVARVQRVLSRFGDYSYAQAPVMVIDKHLSIDFPRSRLVLDGQSAPLTPIETNLLHILVRNQGRIVSPETLMARVWPNVEVFEETLRVHMHRLRRKLQSGNGQLQYIRTERGVGYSFSVPDDQA